MTPPPPAEPDGPSLPPRHRPNKDSLASDTTERGFWDLDDLGDVEAPGPALAKVEPRRTTPPPAPPPGPIKSGGESVPVLASNRDYTRRMSGVEKFLSAREAKTAQDSETAPEPVLPFTPHRGDSMEDTFDELEQWEAPAVTAPTQRPVEEVFDALADSLEATPAPTPKPSSEPTGPTAPEATPPRSLPASAPSDNEFVPVENPNAKPFSLRPYFNLSLLETIGVASLALVLLAGGGWVYQQTLKRIGHTDASHGQVEYPVRGSHVTVTKLVSYWRPPITTGDKPEIVRRGVVLIPVVELTLSGGPGAVRVLFNNELGKKTGDPITLAVNGEATRILAATDGFEDVSMHAAYRTDLAKPWVLQVSEAPSENSPGAEFKTLLKTPISPEKR